MTIRSKLFTLFFPFSMALLLILSALFYFQYKYALLHSNTPALAYVATYKKWDQSPLPVLRATQVAQTGSAQTLFEEKNMSLPKFEVQKSLLFIKKPTLSSIEELEENLMPVIHYTYPLENGGYIELTLLAKTIKEHLSVFLIVTLLVFGVGICVFTLFFLYFEKIYAKPLEKLSIAGLQMVSHKTTTLPTSELKEIRHLADLMSHLGSTINEQNERLKDAGSFRRKYTFTTETMAIVQDLVCTKKIRSFQDDQIQMDLIDLTSDHLVAAECVITKNDDLVELSWIRAQKPGFAPLVEMLKHPESLSSIQLQINKTKQTLTPKAHLAPLPLLYSVATGKLTAIDKTSSFEKGDYLFVPDLGLVQFLPVEVLMQIFSKILPNFHEEGLGAICQLLEKEFKILEKKNLLQESSRLILIQL